MWFTFAWDTFVAVNNQEPKTVHLTQEAWDKVRHNHFITIPGDNRFFGLNVSITDITMPWLT